MLDDPLTLLNPTLQALMEQQVPANEVHYKAT